MTIPPSVTSIGRNAFYWCSGLSSFVVIDNPVYSSLNGILYNKEQTRLIQCPCKMEGTVVVPEGVTTIAPGAFSGCSRITSLTIPTSVKSLAYGTFVGCSGLTSMTLPFVGAKRGNSGDYALLVVFLAKRLIQVQRQYFKGTTSATQATIISFQPRLGLLLSLTKLKLPTVHLCVAACCHR